jgi:WS/DGAT/MGAT family acyltransferase
LARLADVAAALRWKGEGMSATEPLSPLDATFLELEEADVTAHMHIGGVLVFDPLPGGGTPTLARVRRHLERRLDELPRYRQRLSSRTTGGLHWPSWVPDERFDIAAHVTRAALPKPGGERELLAWAADFWSHRLDRGRPLWRVVLLQGLAGGRWALVTKTHHCLVDGVGSVDAGSVLLDDEPQPPRRRPAPPSPPDVEPHRPGAIRRLAALPLAATEAAVDLVRHPRRAAEGLDSARALVELLVRDELVAAPKTSLNVPLSEHRRIAVTEVSLEELKAIKRALGGTVNDVVLAVVTGALREWLHGRGIRTEGLELRALVPVSIRAEDERGNLGNRIAAMRGPLPVYVEDPVRRLRVVSEEMEGLKRSKQALGAEVIARFNDFAPPTLLAQASRVNFSTRLFNLIVTNVPGPQLPLYVLGRELQEVFPVAFLPQNHAMAVAIMSYNGRIGFGLLADYDSMDDIDVIATGIEESLAELEEAASATAAA